MGGWDDSPVSVNESVLAVISTLVFYHLKKRVDTDSMTPECATNQFSCVQCTVPLRVHLEKATTLHYSVGHDSAWLTKLMFVLRYPLTPLSYTLTLSVVGRAADCKL